jgi:hypothetical protein
MKKQSYKYTFYNISKMNIIKNLQSAYDKYENNEINKAVLIAQVRNFNLPSEKTGKILQSIDQGRSFTSIVNDINIFNKERNIIPTYNKEELKDTTELRNKFSRFKKSATSEVKPPWDNSWTNGVNKNAQNERLKDMVNNLTRGAIEVGEFENFLRDRNINPNVESISKHLRNSKYSRINHKDLLCSLMNYQEVYVVFNFRDYNPNKINIKKQTFNYSSINFNRDQQKQTKISLVNPNFLSQKHLFEWENDDQSLNNQSVGGFKPRKLIIGNRVYGDENNKNYHSTSQVAKSHNILLGDYETTESKGIRKRNPNFTFIQVQKPEKVSKRCASAHHTSYDNPLKFNY